ncbi:SH3 domain-containing protein [Streptomyces sp. NPDC050504]|uniref:SH3 domain-containing protein n=1 Tax=Streptomyces sp. NPDC050504 TaxID=3365618 RepID=UPI00378F703E
MSSPSPLAGAARRIALCAAAGALTATLAAAPASALSEEAAAHSDYKGRVTAKSGLLLRDKPTRSSRIVGHAAYGAVVHIFCKTSGETVNGNPRWYLLTDGTWAWASAAYIANIGPAPRWC